MAYEIKSTVNSQPAIQGLPSMTLVLYNHIFYLLLPNKNSLSWQVKPLNVLDNTMLTFVSWAPKEIPFPSAD